MPSTVYLFIPLTERCRTWVDENVGVEDWQWLGSGFGVDHRYIGTLVEAALTETGFELDVDFRVEG